MDQGRGLRLLRRAPDVEPRAHEITNVVAQVLVTDADTCGAHDKTARRNVFLGANRLDQLAQAMAFVV